MPYSRANGVDIWYEVSGDGPVMILVHANPFDHNLWMYQAAHFSTWFKVINIDIRGYGRSVKMTTSYTLKDMCDDIVGVMKDENIDKAILMGCSVGSSIGIMLGLDHPELFEAIVLVGGDSSPSNRYHKRIEGYTADLKSYHLRHMQDLVHPDFFASPRGKYLLNTFVERQPRLKGEAIVQVYLAFNAVDTTERLSEMAVPTLVINGEVDYSRPGGERTARLIPGAVHKVLPNTGHACCIEDPAGFDELVISYLSARGLMPSLV